jgi:AraC-like DNA-binding protein
MHPTYPDTTDNLERRSVVGAGYTEHAPPRDLAAYVNCFWTSLTVETDASRPRTEHRVLPDGCVDIVIGFRHGTEVTNAIGVGSMTRPLVINGDRVRLYIGVRFSPGSAFAAFGIPAAELTDDNVEYARLARDADSDLDALSAESTNDDRLAAVVRLIQRRLAGRPVVPASVRAAVRRVATAHGNLRVADLASEIGITRQQLARQFATHVGVTPKTFARVMRAQTALARADAARAAYPRIVDWSGIAYELGYYDQPHFIDDFKALTGLTPSKWTNSV